MGTPPLGRRQAKRLAVLACLAWLPGLAAAPGQDYSERGADDCVVCHGPGMPLSAVALLATPHGARGDPAAPMGGLQCEACHGPSAAHARAQSAGDNVAPAVVFGRQGASRAGEQNAVCLGCHEGGSRGAWEASAHAGAEVPCAACHQVHRAEDRVFDAMAQQQACFDCHQRQRADSLKPSAHPLRFGLMSCSDCHDPHAGDHDALLVEASVNDTCFGCHAEKRGPFLWEHAPAAEDCTLCHRPHGSNHAALLTRRPPLLCQQCHAPSGHPSLAYTGADFEDDFRNRFMLARGCLNCHSQVHGSNHPSGATLHR